MSYVNKSSSLIFRATKYHPHQTNQINSSPFLILKSFNTYERNFLLVASQNAFLVTLYLLALLPTLLPINTLGGQTPVW